MISCVVCYVMKTGRAIQHGEIVIQEAQAVMLYAQKVALFCVDCMAVDFSARFLTFFKIYSPTFPFYTSAIGCLSSFLCVSPVFVMVMLCCAAFGRNN